MNQRTLSAASFIVAIVIVLAVGIGLASAGDPDRLPRCNNDPSNYPLCVPTE